ncbi:hypothetical protein GCM10023310_68950 [Paenibacillus vulneris]|uniref:Uncharacterized protein n=1 Tax=Paenibacillus vulneris TaxID=1133364 RepID=A0ABW3UFI0_9BACL
MEEKTKKTYDDLLESIDLLIEKHKLSNDISDGGKYYYIQGLDTAKQIIEQEQDFVYNDYAYEKFEQIVQTFLNWRITQNLEPEEMHDILEREIAKLD